MRKNKTKINKTKRNKDNLILKYSDILNDYLSQGESIEKSLNYLRSKIGKNKEKINLNSIIKKSKKTKLLYNENNDVEYYLKIFTEKLSL